MVKVVAPGSLPYSSHLIGPGSLNGGTMVKRKTPSELRGEQLKRASALDLIDESPSHLSGTSNEVDNGLKRPGLSRNPKYIDTRVDDIFPAKKSRFRMISGKENAKENPSAEKNLYVFSNSTATRQQEISCLENTVASSKVSKDGILESCHTMEKCSQGKFLSVTELSSSADRSLSLAAIDVGKALRGLAASEPHASYGFAANASGRRGDATSTTTGSFVTECHVPGHEAPLDLTLKTCMRVVTSSVNRIHRSFMHCTMPQFTFQHSTFKGQYMSGHSHLTSNFQGFKVLHSWMYPQSILPPSLISVLSSSLADGVELEFLRKRQVDWEESFRDLYYLLRTNTCGIFYVCTSQFVVMFTGGDGSDRPKSSCTAYISQSTRGLRSLLREHDVSFSMPLCHSNKVEQVATEDLVELSEIEKHNLGQTRRLRSFSDVDNTPESLLVFSGNMNVHGLYDLLLNYRSFFTSLSSMDVPVLCSPVPFQNAAISSPHIKCMEMRRAEQIAASYDESDRNGVEFKQGSSDGLCCSIEIKDTFLPPWITSGICSLMGSEAINFEASFVTEPISIGLNVALKSTCENSESQAAGCKNLRNCSDTFGIPGAVVVPSMWTCSLNGLKYSDDSYTASLSPV